VTERRPLVSIGLPVFNGERFLRESLASNLVQTVEDFELVVCDNASTDGTLEILNEVAAGDERVRVLTSDENLGAAANYNRTVALARGRYFRWATHDDLVAPNHLERLLCAYEEGPPSMVLAYPKTTIIDADSVAVEEYEDCADARAPQPHRRLRTMLRNLSLCNPVLGLTQLEVIRRTRLIGPYPSSDKVFLYEMALRGEVVEVPERLFFRRRAACLASPSNLAVSEQAAWFDPHRCESNYHWTLMRNGFEAVRRAPVSFMERQRCRLTLLRDAVRWRRHLWAELRGGSRA
jgi:glycosyltransferase involved in cell wall biosynthesis